MSEEAIVPKEEEKEEEKAEEKAGNPWDAWDAWAASLVGQPDPEPSYLHHLEVRWDVLADPVRALRNKPDSPNHSFVYMGQLPGPGPRLSEEEAIAEGPFKFNLSIPAAAGDATLSAVYMGKTTGYRSGYVRYSYVDVEWEAEEEDDEESLIFYSPRMPHDGNFRSPNSYLMFRLALKA
jgi:hypothetical protein